MNTISRLALLVKSPTAARLTPLPRPAARLANPFGECESTPGIVGVDTDMWAQPGERDDYSPREW
jgi:hypothetical protein